MVLFRVRLPSYKSSRDTVGAAETAPGASTERTTRRRIAGVTPKPAGADGDTSTFSRVTPAVYHVLDVKFCVDAHDMLCVLVPARRDG